MIETLIILKKLFNILFKKANKNSIALAAQKNILAMDLDNSNLKSNSGNVRDLKRYSFEEEICGLALKA